MSSRPIDSVGNSSPNRLNRETNYKPETSDRLKLYSLAAVAAGVSVLALGQPAESEVIVTKKNLPVPMSRNCCEGVEISLSNNGVNDFSVSLLNYTTKYISVRHLNIKPLSKGAAIIESNNNALALARGANIGRSGPFDGGYEAYIERTNILTNGTKRYYGNWGGNPQNRYLGVRFFINGKVHFGWVRLTVNTSPLQLMTATITAYAYETVPNRRILAGTPDKAAAGVQPEAQAEDTAQPSLGMLALGIDGLPLWRREQNVGAK
jgi:hypothetical protein